jgi:hypothetical protein
VGPEWVSRGRAAPGWSVNPWAKAAKSVGFAVAPGLLSRSGMCVSEVMSRDVKTIGAWQSCREAVALMFRGGLRHLPIIVSYP